MSGGQPSVALVGTPGPWRQAFRRLRRNRASVASLVVLATLIALAVLAPWISPYEYDAPSLGERFSPPGAKHWFGTDSLGRDLLSRVLAGARVSFSVGLLATAVSLVIGISWGSIAGWCGGRWDALMMRIVDALYAMPYMIFVILILVIIENKSHGVRLMALFVAIGAVQWLTMARIVRGQVLSLKEREFVEAARAIGMSGPAIVVRHLLPNLMGPIVVYATLTVPQVMLQEAFLSFLGLGISAPYASWGTLAADGAAAINPLRIRLWLIVFPSAALALTLFSLNFLGDGLRDALDPRSARGRG